MRYFTMGREGGKSKSFSSGGRWRQHAESYVGQKSRKPGQG